MANWYNEIDDGAATWLEELIACGELPDGVVDRRSIKDVQPDDLRGFDQCHFFAGIGIWPLALRRAGWPDARPTWTGSCPCQPFSPAGKGLGFEDPRHLWPDWFRLVAERRPHTIFGEQSSAAGLWVDLVRSDLEGIGAAFGCPDLPAAGFAEGPHLRQRFYWLADLHDAERWADVAAGHFGDWPQAGRIESHGEPGAGGATGGLAHHHHDGQPGRPKPHVGTLQPRESTPRWDHALRRGPADGLGHHHHHHQGPSFRSWPVDERGALRVQGPAVGPASALRGCDWLLCHDARIRPVEAGTFPLAATDPTRVGRLRGYGNALDLETAVNFVAAYLEADMLS